MTTLALCGAGLISTVHALAARAQPDLQITRVASRSWDVAVTRAEQYGAQPCTYAELPAGADIVLVCTPPAAHTEQAIQSLQGGAAVIIEKPMATTLEDADRLVEASERSGGRIGYAENLAFSPAVVRALARRDQQGQVDQEPFHHLDLRVLQSRPTWGDFLTASWGGGALFDLGAHPIALALLLAAPARADWVSAVLTGATDIEVDEHAEATIGFDDGLVAQLTVSWRNAPDDDMVWDLQAASEHRVVRVELSPTYALEINGEPVALPDPPAALPSPQLEQMGYTTQLDHFAAAFRAGREPRIGAPFGREVLDVICGAYRSARFDGRREPLPFTGDRRATPLALWRG